MKNFCFYPAKEEKFKVKVDGQVLEGEYGIEEVGKLYKKFWGEEEKDDTASLL